MVIETKKPVKKVIYICWNDTAHVSGTHIWESEPISSDVLACPVCGEVVRVTQKL
jgi:hypothetical protein